MATYTSNYNLSKPENTDTNASFISAYRENMDIIDKQMGNKNIAEEYDNTQTYAVDDYVIYDGDLYKCVTAVTTAEDFDSTKWTQTVASDEFGSGGGGGSSTLAGLSDVNLTTPSNGQVLKYNSTSQKWENANESGGGGGGGSFAKDILFQNTGSSAPSTINLTHAISDYDAIYFTGYRSQYTSYWASALYLSDDCVTGRNIGLTDDTMYGWYTVTNSTTLTLIGSVNMVVDKVYGVKFGSGGSGSLDAIETTSNAYALLPQADKEDPTKIYFLNDTQSSVVDTPIDQSTFVLKVENQSQMSVAVTNGKLVSVYNYGSSIGACAFEPNAISATASKIKYKFATIGSYDTAQSHAITIGVKANYQSSNWIFSTDTDWLVKKVYDARNTSVDDYIDISGITTPCYLMICFHGWTVTFDEFLVEDVSIPTGDTEIRYKDVAYAENRIEELTQTEYDALPDSKYSDDVVRFVYSTNQILDPDYTYHKYGDNDEIIVRVYHEGESDQSILWFFRGWNQSSGDMAIPSSLQAYAPSDTSTGRQSANYPDAPYTTQNGWIGFYNGNIRGWSTDFYNFYTGICHCVVDPNGSYYPNPQTNPYVDDPYVYITDPSNPPTRRIYLNTREYAEFNSGGGHTIIDENDTEVAQEPNMQFTGKVEVTDDSTNEKTVVEVLPEVVEVTQAQYNALPSTKLTDGVIYCIKDSVDGVDAYPPLIYSTEEREVGVWTDGKPIYQISLVGTGSNHIDISNLNIDTFCGVDAGGTYIIRHDTQQTLFLDSTNPQGYNYGWIMAVNSAKTEIEIVKNAYSIDDYVFTIRYTKTTDTAGSGIWNGQGGYAHHYNTTPTVVGTWIDGSALYEQTVPTGGNPPVGYALIQRTVQSGYDTILFVEFNAHFIEYIQGTGTQYINTGVIPTANTTFKITLSDIVADSGERAIFGAGSYSNAQYLLTKDASTHYIQWYYPSKQMATTDYTSKHVIELYRGLIKVDGQAVTSQSGSGTTGSAVTLFNVAGSYFSSYRLYSFQMYDGETLVFDGKPAKDSNNITCLYDAVSGDYLYNSGSGDFVAGLDVN